MLGRCQRIRRWSTSRRRCRLGVSKSAAMSSKKTTTSLSRHAGRAGTAGDPCAAGGERVWGVAGGAARGSTDVAADSHADRRASLRSASARGGFDGGTASRTARVQNRRRLHPVALRFVSGIGGAGIRAVRARGKNGPFREAIERGAACSSARRDHRRGQARPAAGKLNEAEVNSFLEGGRGERCGCISVS